MALSQEKLISFITENNLSNRIISLHSSFRSLGGFEGDVSEFCSIFLDHGCTLMVPAHSWENALARPLSSTPTIQSRWDYSHIMSTGFNPDSTVVDSDKGIITTYLMTHPRRVRSNNPLGSFIAVGPSAEELLKETDGYHTQFERLTELDGTIVLLGIDCSKMSYIHYVKELCGISLVYRWVHTEEGEKWLLGGGCSKNFGDLAPLLKPVTAFTELGDASVQILQAREVLPLLKDHFERNGDTTRCKEFCDACAEEKEIEVIDENDYYQIKEGDNVWDLADHFGVPREHLLSLSEDENFILGQWLSLKEIRDTSGYYQVQPGDSFELIAERCGISIEEIKSQCEGDNLFAYQWISLKSLSK